VDRVEDRGGDLHRLSAFDAAVFDDVGECETVVMALSYHMQTVMWMWLA
jgi:hypothetical protein